jgi:hypothetical protein
MQELSLIFLGSVRMNEKRLHQKIIKLSKIEKNKLEEVLKRTAKTFTELVIERVLNYFQDQTLLDVKRILKMENIYRSIFYELPVEESLKSSVYIYRVGDVLKFNDGRFATIVKLLETEKVLKICPFPFILEDKTDLIFLENIANSFKIYRR